MRLRAEGKYLPTAWNSVIFGRSRKDRDFDPEEVIDGLIERMNGGAE